jgi:PTS hybrid protein
VSSAGLVGLVVVSHSASLAAGVVEVAAQMAPDVTVVAAGGTPGGGIGTDFDAVTSALAEADGGAGVVVLYDLGSARMVAEMAVELVDGARLVDAPLVEGTVAAAVAAQGGADLSEVAHAAEDAAGVPGGPPPGGLPPASTANGDPGSAPGWGGGPGEAEPVGEVPGGAATAAPGDAVAVGDLSGGAGVGRASGEVPGGAAAVSGPADGGRGLGDEGGTPPPADGPAELELGEAAAELELGDAERGGLVGAVDVMGAMSLATGVLSDPDEVTVTLTNEIGLHARPAALVARTMATFDARVTVRFRDAKADGRSVLALVALGARGGDRLRVSATGARAEEALRAFQDLAARNFDE